MAEKDLDFKVILNDEQFDAQISKDIKLAEQFNIQLSALLDLKTKVGKTTMVGDSIKAERLQKATADAAAAQERLRTATINTATAQERNATAAANAANAQERLKMTQMRSEQLAKRIAEQTKKQNNAYLQQSRILNELKGVALGYLSIHGASQLLSSLVRVTGEFELQKTTLAAMIGDLNKAEGIITRIQGLAVESPFQFKELTTYAKQLSAFSVPAEELYNTTKMLADISAGLGVGMDRIVLAYGQVRSAAFLRGQEVRQFTEAGIPILDELAKQFSELEGRVVSTTEVFDKISKRLVPFEMVAKVFKDMTSEGGKFFNMQEVQAETLKGKISNLKDAYEVMLNEIGKGQSENLKGAVDWARKLMTNYEDTGKVLVDLIATYGIYKGVLISLEVATNTFALANHKLISSLVSVGKYIASNPFMVLAAGITAAGYALYKNHTQLEGYEKIQKSIAKTQADYTKDISKESAKLDALYAKLRLAKEGTEDYNEARKAIYSQYAGYISELRAEGIEVNDLAGIYENLKTKIEDAVSARTSSKAKQKLTETYDQEIDSYYDQYIDIITKAQKQLNMQAKRNGGEYKEFTEFEKAGFWKYLTGAMNKGDLERTSGLERVVRILDNANLDAAANLKHLRNSIISTTNEYETSLKKIKVAYGEIETEGGGIIPPLATQSNSDEAVKALEKEINALQTLKKEYEDWKALGVSDESIQLSLMGYFPNIKAEYGEDFITQLNYATRILEKIKELEKIAPDEAFNLMTSFGLDKASLDKQAVRDQQKAFEDSAKAAGKYFDTLRKWMAEDFNLDGEGISLDISKIASDLNEKIKEIELRSTKTKELFDQIDVDSEEEVAKVKEIFVKEFGADAWEQFWKSYQDEGFRAIENLADKQKEYEKKLAQEKVNDLAKKYVSEAYFDNSIELSDLGEKNFFQLREIRKKLQGLLDKEPLRVPIEVQTALSNAGVDVTNLVNVDLDKIFEGLDEIDMPISEADQEMLLLIQSIQKAGLSTKNFGDVIKKVIGGDLKNITQEEGELLMSMVKSYNEEIKKLLSSLSEYAEAIGNEELQGAVNGIAEAMDILGGIADRLAKGDWIGAIISGLTSLTSTVMEAVTKQYALNDAIAKTRNEMLLINSQKAIEKGVFSIFGEDEYKRFKNSYEEVKRTHADVIKDLERQNWNFWGRSKDNWGLGGVAGSLAAGAGLGAAVGSVVPVIGTAIGAGVGALVGMIVGLVGHAATQANDYAISLKQMAEEIGADLINEDTGVFDVETLKKIKETYTDLDKEYQEILDRLIANGEVFQNAVTEMADFMTEIFGKCADEMADSFIASFKESGEAALEYGALMDTLATDIAKSIIKSTILQNVFDEQDAKEAAVKLASGDTAGALQVVEDAMQAAQELSPYIQQLFESLKPYFEMEPVESQNLSAGIKGITEDTANLLASYLNAIRADVSYAKTLWERMDATTQQIATMISNLSVPSLVEYQQQIAANTFNTAIATQAILSRLDSVITSEGGFDAIRTYS